MTRSRSARLRHPAAHAPAAAPRTRTAVRDAVLTGLSEHGYPALTVEYVAEHSGVHKTTLYRRWGSVEGLLADALDLANEDAWTPPDTGSLSGDLRALAHEVVDAFGDPATGAAPTAFVGAAFQSPRAAEALRAFYVERFRRCEVVVTRAVTRGEAPPGTDAGAAVRAVSAPCSCGSSSPANRSTERSRTRPHARFWQGCERARTSPRRSSRLRPPAAGVPPKASRADAPA